MILMQHSVCEQWRHIGRSSSLLTNRPISWMLHADTAPRSPTLRQSSILGRDEIFSLAGWRPREIDSGGPDSAIGIPVTPHSDNWHGNSVHLLFPPESRFQLLQTPDSLAWFVSASQGIEGTANLLLASSHYSAVGSGN